MLDEHEACREEMSRIHADWSDRWYKGCQIKNVLKRVGKPTDQHGQTDTYLAIIDIIREPDGLTVIVK